MIRNQVAQLSAVAQPVLAPTPALPVAPLPSQQAPPQQEPNLSSLFAPNALAQLLASTATQQQPTPPPPQPPLPVRQVQIPSSQATPSLAPIPAGGESSLLASLRAAGMLPPLNNTPTLPAAVPASLPFPFPPRAVAHTPVPPPAVPRSTIAHIGNDVELTSASLKVYANPSNN